MTRREKLIEFVIIQHGKQIRKYTGEPYVVHLLAVARTAEEAGAEFGFEIGLCHDLVEDVKDFTNEMLRDFLLSIGYSIDETEFICKGVEDLTDVYTSDAFPNMNREARKTAEAQRQGTISTNSQTIKYCDLIDNSLSITEHDPEFAQVYLVEKERILNYMVHGDQESFQKCLKVLEESKQKLENYLVQESLRRLEENTPEKQKLEKEKQLKDSVKKISTTRKDQKLVEQFAREEYNKRFPREEIKPGTWHSFTSFKVLSETSIKVEFTYGYGDIESKGVFIVEI